MNIIESYVKPYLFWFKVAGIAVVLSAAFIGGCNVQKNRDAVVIQKKDQALKEASASLTAAAKALQAQKDENARRIAADEQAKKDAANAGVLVDAEKKAMQIRIEGYEKALKNAKKNDVCEALLTCNVKDVNMKADVKKVCGL